VPEASTPPAIQARPVADLPLDAILARADELARQWAIALILARPLEGIGEVPLADLAREAPALCAQVLRALQSDAELERLTGGGASSGGENAVPARSLAAIAGADDAAAAVEAIEALRGVLWEALLEELRWPRFERSSARQVADLSDRLAHVCACAAAATVQVAPGRPVPGRNAEPASSAAPAGGGAPGRMPAARRPAVIVDERAPEESPAHAARLLDPSSVLQPPPPAPPRPPRSEIEIRDQRAASGPAAWIGSIGRQLERFAHDGRPFAVLLIQLERRPGEAPQGEVSRQSERVEEALAAERRAIAGSLTRERAGRYWLLAPQTDRVGARHLAERLVRASEASSGHGAPVLEVAIGTSVCPEDGRGAAALAAHADLDLYAARSAARSARGRSSRAGADRPS